MVNNYGLNKTNFTLEEINFSITVQRYMIKMK